MRERNRLLYGAAFVALSASAPAVYAQDAPKSELEAAPLADAVAGGDIVVTAQRTSSLASKTPIALTAIGGDALRTAGITNATALGDQVPNLSIDRTGGLQITIRGITSRDNTEKGDPSAAFLLDGIYIARPQAQEVSFFDIDRVEVLRGPQGTLYGKNTTAGVVNVITKKPSDKFEAAANVAYGNYDSIQADAMVNIPVNAMLALRFGGSFDRRDSYLIKSAGDRNKFDPFKNNLSARAQALFTFSPDINLLIKGDYSRMRGSDSLIGVVADGTFYRPQPNQFDYTDAVYAGAGKSSADLRRRGYSLLGDQSTRNHTWGVSGEFNWDFGPVMLTYLGSYREFKRDEFADTVVGGVAGGAPTPRNTRFTGLYTQQSHEVRFATTGTGPLKVQFGGMYFREQSGIALFLKDFVPGVPYFGFPQDPTIVKSFGVFGQATYSLTDTLRITAGARYSKDDKSRVGLTVMQRGPVFNPATDSSTLNSASAKFDKITWRAGVDFDVNDRTLLYGSVSTGYKAGGFNDGCEAGVATRGRTCTVAESRPLDRLYYKPETLTAYELGLKTRFADNAVRLTLAAFYYDYNNLQLNTSQIFLGVPVNYTTNAGKARVKGVEADATITPDSRNRFDLSFSWLDAEYTDYTPNPIGQNGQIVPIDYKGRALDRSPKYVASAGYSYSQPLGNGGSIDFGARSRLSDSYVITAFNVPRQYRQPSFTRSEVNLTYNAPDHRWYVQGFAKNLENAITVNAVSFNPPSLGRDSLTTVVPGDPRTYGIRAGVKF
ncbi:MAG: TonB-dependent receptor [Pseudomonadota bacterium]